MSVSTTWLACGVHDSMRNICFIVPQSHLIGNYICKDMKEGKEESIVLEKNIKEISTGHIGMK